MGHHRRRHHHQAFDRPWAGFVTRWPCSLKPVWFPVEPGVVSGLDRTATEPAGWIWTATAESILDKVRCGRVALQEAVAQ
jgi:hypothetical protein